MTIKSEQRKYIEEIKEKSGISSLSSATQKDGATLIDLIRGGQLGEMHVLALMQIHPHLLALTAEALKSAIEAVSIAGNSQQEIVKALKEHHADNKVMIELAKKAESDEARVELAKIQMEISKNFCEAVLILNQENNRAILDCLKQNWKVFALTITGVLVMSGSVIVKKFPKETEKT